VVNQVGTAALVLALSLGVVASGGLGTPDPDARGIDWLGVVLVTLTAAPLVARRRSPLIVYLATCAPSIGLVSLHYPVDFPFGPVVALYAVATTYGVDPRPRQRRTAMVLAGAFVPLAAAAHVASGYHLRGLAAGLAFWALTFVGVWIAGDRTRLRRERIDALEERAARAERDAERERRLAAAEERTRIARELHDSAGHAINVILVQAGAARLLHERDAQGSQRAIATIEHVARDTISEIDQLVRALREDDDDPLLRVDPAALEELLEHHRATGLKICADVHGEHRALPRSVAWAGYRILQEALTNAARHGDGTADVDIRFRSETFEITVTNPTAGRPARTSGHGIVGMRERAGLLGGTLRTSDDNGAFRLSAQLPCGEMTQ
jgi:signal transduction histidine kinase